MLDRLKWLPKHIAILSIVALAFYLAASFGPLYVLATYIIFGVAETAYILEQAKDNDFLAVAIQHPSFWFAIVIISLLWLPITVAIVIGYHLGLIDAP